MDNKAGGRDGQTFFLRQHGGVSNFRTIRPPIWQPTHIRVLVPRRWDDTLVRDAWMVQMSVSVGDPQDNPVRVDEGGGATYSKVRKPHTDQPTGRLSSER